MDVPDSVQFVHPSHSSHADKSLCSSCITLFRQPTQSPDADSDADPTKSPYRRLGKDILTSVHTGCQLCTIVWSKIFTLLRRQVENIENIIISPNLCWDNEADTYCGLVYWGVGERGTGSVYPEMFQVNISLESDVEDVAPGQLRPPDTESDHCRSLAARWILECVSTHEECRNRGQRSWLPTRLIDVGHAWPTMKPRLVMTSDFPKQASAPLYTSLSHLWAAETVLRLTTINQDELMQAIPLADLSPTFRDAISMTRQLGVRFLWIDSLCILQDSPDDWAAESSVMNQVYKHSVCNFAATAASDYSCGLYQRRDPRMVTPHRIQIQRKGHEQSYIYSLGDDYHHAVSKANLNLRGWVFQERMLSPRTLHFSSQLAWECRMLHACETYPTGYPRAPASLINDVETQWPNCKLWAKDIHTDATSTWTLLVQSYCKTQLTRPSDRLAAIAGLAQEMHSNTNHDYLAGLWKQQLPYGLCWMLYGTVNSGSVTNPEKYRCPSWSWASLDFSGNSILEFLDGATTQHQLATVLDTHIQSPSNNIYTNITGGFIRLQGKLGRVRLSRLQNASWRGDRGGHFTYEYSLDTTGGPCHEDMESYPDRGAVSCIPVATYDRANPGTLESLQIYCILLERAGSTAAEFRRIGWMSVLCDWEEEVDRELRWIARYARAEPQVAGKLDVVTIA